MDYLARFVVEIISQLDLSKLYAGYADRGGEAIAPEVLLGLLFYGYATGTFSSRKLEKATYENLGFRYVGGGLHPVSRYDCELSDNLSGRVGRFVCADIDVGKVSRQVGVGESQFGWEQDLCGCLEEPCSQLWAVDLIRRQNYERKLASCCNWVSKPIKGKSNCPKIWSCQMRSACARAFGNLANAKAVLEARAQERYEAEKAEYDRKVREREAKARKHRKRSRGRAPKNLLKQVRARKTSTTSHKLSYAS